PFDRGCATIWPGKEISPCLASGGFLLVVRHCRFRFFTFLPQINLKSLGAQARKSQSFIFLHFKQINIKLFGNVNSRSGHKLIDWLFEGITFFAGCQAPVGSP
ncbi:MAG: hypothetical protein ACK53L_03480, partial [Pirellulaceae bacterium]